MAAFPGIKAANLAAAAPESAQVAIFEAGNATKTIKTKILDKGNQHDQENARVGPDGCRNLQLHEQ